MNRHYFTDQMGRKLLISAPPKRIVSIVPSQTELLFDLGLDAEIVGVTKFCIHPAGKIAGKTRVGGTKLLDIQKIRKLQPDLIIANKEENEQRQVEQLLSEFNVWISDISSLADALGMITEIGNIVSRDLEARQITGNISSGFSSLKPMGTRLRAAYFIWKNPYMVAGCDTFIHEMMAMAGWENAFHQNRYPVVSEQQIRDAAPDVIFLSSEPYPFKETHATEFRSLCPSAKVLVVDGELFSWYGSRLRYTADYLNELQLQLME